MKIKALNGFKDILPDEVERWLFLENHMREILHRFNFTELRIPIIEKTALFARSIGEATDIVEKEMYTFIDKQMTLRPEATASIVRAYIEHGLYVKKPVQRLFTIGPMFRHERPQKGRLRQFHQMSAEILGSDNGRIDAELMAMAAMVFDTVGLTVSLELNSLGCPECRPDFRKNLLDFLKDKRDDLCEDCKRRIDRNPLRVLDCKKEQCRKIVETAPSVLDHLCSVCKDHFTVVTESLDQLGVAYRLNRFMVRGLDYYCRTTFEFLTTDLGAQAAVCAGGRYDGLIELLGGPKTPGIGFALGLERMVLLLQQQEKNEGKQQIDLFLAGLGSEANTYCYTLMHGLRGRGLRVAMDIESRSLKSQMKQADKANASFVLIVGEEELTTTSAVLRNMKTQEQVGVELREEEIAAVIATLEPHV